MDDYKVAAAATDWWIEQMTKRCKDLYPDKVTDDNSNLIIIDDSLRLELSRFKDVLSKAIKGYVTQRTYVSLTCYYRPNSELTKLANQASISGAYFPARAAMEICCGSVNVSLGDQSMHKLSVSTKKM